MNDFNEDVRLSAEQILDYQFKDPALLAQALTHASVSDGRLRSNERMEFLGDAILGKVVCEYLFHHYPQYMEGELTKIKSAVVSRRVCAAISDAAGLTNLLVLGKGMSGRDQMPASLAAAVYEAVVAAIYLDGGAEPAERFILRHMEQHIAEAAHCAHQQNFKSVLQQHAQRHLTDLPTYIVLDEKGPDHAKCFEVCVEIGDQRYPSAWGQNKKQAEQQAALNALRAIGVIDADDHGHVILTEEEAD